MNTNRHESENHSLPLQFGILEIEQDAGTTFGDTEVVEHLPSLMIGDSVDDFCVNNDSFECDEIRCERPDNFATIGNAERGLLLERNGPMPEFHNERVLVRLLMEPMPNPVEHVDGRADDLKDFVFEQQLLIRVRWCSFVVSIPTATTCRVPRGHHADAVSPGR